MSGLIRCAALMVVLGIYSRVYALAVLSALSGAVMVFACVSAVKTAKIAYGFDERGIVERSQKGEVRIDWRSIKFIGIKKETTRALGVSLVIARGGDENVLNIGAWYRPEHKAITIVARDALLQEIKKFWKHPLINEDNHLRLLKKRGEKKP